MGFEFRPADPSLGEEHVPITTAFTARAVDCRDSRAVSADARHHHSGFAYRFAALPRLRAHLLSRADWVVDSWSAAAIHGFGQFSDGADTCLLGPGRSTYPASPLEPQRRRLQDDVPRRRWRWAGMLFDVVTPEVALVRCLVDVLSGKHGWGLPPVPEPRFTRAVQLVDAYRLAGHSLAAVPATAKGRINARLLRRILRASDGGAESPRETLLRLLLNRIEGLDLVSQVPVFAGERLVTRFDLADRARQVGFMYDGAHHGGGDQWKKDAEITLELTQLGWTVVRVVSTMMEDPGRLLRMVSDLVRPGAADYAG